MKVHTNAFKEQIKEMGKELDSLITFDGTELGAEQLNSVTPSFESSILKSAMKMLEIDSNIEIPKGSVVNYKFGVKVNGVYEYLDFGNYIVYSVEKEEDTLSYKIVCYDKMLNTMKDYVSLQNGTFPMTIRNYIKNLCLDCGLTFKNTNDEFANYDKVIESDLYANLGYTYRDIFDELSAVTGSTICLDKEDNVEIRYVTDTLDIIDEEYLKDINVNFGEKYGPVNSIVLSRSGESDNVYLQDEESVATNGLTELKIVDNQIMNFNNRADFLPGILSKLNGLEYYTNDFVSTGVTYYDICDKYNVKIGENIYSCVMFNDEVLVTQGLEENIFTEMPEETKTDYSKSDKDDRRINQAYIIVDKQNQQINALLSKVDENSEKIVSFDATINDIKSSVSDTETLVKDLENSIDLFSVDLSQYTLTIPTDSSKKPLETRSYDINFYGYFKGKQVVPSVTVDNSNSGITTSTTSTYIRFSVDMNNIITNLTNNYMLTFTYNSPDGVYKLTKGVTVTLSTQGKDGTSVNILGSYNSLEELKQAHPTGNVGDAYIVQGDMYVWSVEDNTWIDVGDIQGPPGTNGKDGENGKSSYQIWLEQGNTGSEQDYLNSLKGKDGEDGYTPIKGKDYFDGKDGKDGEDGVDGYTPIKGIDYFDGKDGTNGTNGKDGKDGTPAYFYVRYSANANGNPMTTTPQSNTEYMGTANTTSPTPPTSYSAYTWVKIKGKDGIDGVDGTNGTPGQDGENGLTPYLHIKYSEDGITFTPADDEYALGEKPSAWFGQYVDYSEADSNDFDDYEWYKFTEDIDPKLEELQDGINDANESINNTNLEVVQLKTDVTQDRESFRVSVEQLTQTIDTNNANVQNNLDNINNTLANGVETLKNTLVTIDIEGISVATNVSKISTLITNNTFAITSSGTNLAYFGYDEENGTSIAEMDNLTIHNYFTAGYHRTEKFEINGEKRTGVFYVGGDE